MGEADDAPLLRATELDPPPYLPFQFVCGDTDRCEAVWTAVETERCWHQGRFPSVQAMFEAEAETSSD